jgi:heme o synthase
MSDTSAATTTLPVAVSGGGVADYFALMKPRVMSLVIFTALVGMVAAPGSINPVLGFIALLMIAVGAGASGALNMWYDADIDAKMGRTAERPIPRGAVTADDALAFGVFFSCASVLVLGLLINWLAGALLAFTIVFYVLVYTMWLKRSTVQNIVIGGAAGALPPVVGWAAVTGSVGLDSLILFLIIFLWTPPHFWALALFRSGDYARAGVPMLPVVAGPEATRRQIVVYTWALVASSLLPLLTGLGHIGYGAVALYLGYGFITRANRLLDAGHTDPSNEKPSKALFGFSILYLFALFGALLVELLARAALRSFGG